MSWSIDTTIRVCIDDDPQLTGRFMQWLSTGGPELIFDAVIDPNGPATFVFHRDQQVAVRNALLDLAQSPPVEEDTNAQATKPHKRTARGSSA